MNPSDAPVVRGTVRSWLRLEALALLVLGCALFSQSGFGWGRFFALFLLPDLSMLGYLAGPRVGARAYNLAHSTVGPLVLAAATFVGLLPASLLALSYIWLAHIGMDRALGYGLKYEEGFGLTHLGLIGRAPRLALA